MKLFLASEAKHPLSVNKLKEFVGGFENKSIAYIPTAANGTGWGLWKEGDSWESVQKLGADVTVVELENYWDTDPLSVLEGKDILWFAGGQCGYLMYWIRRTQLDRHLRGLLEKGSIYVGSSAGSMITAPSLDIVEWYIGENEHGAGVIPGLGLVDFDIYPHYEDDLHDEIKKIYTGKKLYLLKNGEEIIANGTTVTVVGKERTITS